MAKSRKVRRDSVLKKLPAEERALIAGWLESDGAQSCLERMRSGLGIVSNQTSLYEAIAFWEVQTHYSAAESAARSQIEVESEGRLTGAEMEEATDRRFITLLGQQKDVEQYMKLRLLRIADQSAKTKAKQEERKIALAERRVLLLEDNAAQAKSDRLR